MKPNDKAEGSRASDPRNHKIHTTMDNSNDNALGEHARDSSPAAGSPVLGTGFYRDAKPGTFGRSEWLDLLMACQDGRATCMRVLEIIEREMDAQRPSADEMVNRFLCWRLPPTFRPDGGVSFDGAGRDPNSHWWPVGTNLLTAVEAKQMVEHLLANG